MTKIKAVMLLFICLLLLFSVSQSFAQCNKNEIFGAYGFYGNNDKFPEYVSLYGPYTNLTECNTAEENYLKESAQNR